MTTSNPALEGKGLGITSARTFEEETSSMIHEQLARLKFAESRIDMRSKRILDFGCGTGYNCYYVSTQSEPTGVVGIDILEECIEHCKAHYSTPATAYHVQDCRDYNPALGQFDVAISCEVLEHVTEQGLFLDVLKRYLAPGGVAFISTPNKSAFSLGKDKSFLNSTHVKELYFDELETLISARFPRYTIYSQMHRGKWQEAYVNYVSAANLVNVLRQQIFTRGIAAQLVGRVISRALFHSIFNSEGRGYPDVRNRKYTDFEFVEGFHNKAVWFITVCHNE